MLTVLAIPLLWSRLGWPWAHAFLFFSFWSVANLFFLSRMLLGLVEKRGLLRHLGDGFALTILVGILLLFFGTMAPNLWAFACGFHLPYLVVILKVLGWHMTRGSGPADPDAGAASTTEQASKDG